MAAYYCISELFQLGLDCPILTIHSVSADKSAAKYSEMSATLGVLSNIWRVTFKVADTLTGSSSLAL